MDFICMSVVHIYVSCQRHHLWPRIVCHRLASVPLRASPHPPASAALIKMFALKITFVPVPQQNAFIFGKQKSALGESAVRTYAATRERLNLLLLHEFCAASEIFEPLLTSKIKLYQYWP